MGEISQSLALSITRSKHTVSSKMPLSAGTAPVSSADQILAVVGLEPEFIYSRMDTLTITSCANLTRSIK